LHRLPLFSSAEHRLGSPEETSAAILNEAAEFVEQNSDKKNKLVNNFAARVEGHSK
jgi:hypothetical protein